jgi:hypothetical protein
MQTTIAYSSFLTLILLLMCMSAACYAAPHWLEEWKGRYPFITGLYVVQDQMLILNSPMPSIADGGEVYSWDLAASTAVRPLAVDEQGVYLIRGYGQSLYIPGCDATQDWSYGNFYESKDGGLTWLKRRTIPKAMHIFDICRWHNSLAVASSTTYPAGGTVCFSDDEGVRGGRNSWWQRLLAGGGGSYC